MKSLKIQLKLSRKVQSFKSQKFRPIVVAVFMYPPLSTSLLVAWTCPSPASYRLGEMLFEDTRDVNLEREGAGLVSILILN